VCEQATVYCDRPINAKSAVKEKQHRGQFINRLDKGGEWGIVRRTVESHSLTPRIAPTLRGVGKGGGVGGEHNNWYLSRRMKPSRAESVEGIPNLNPFPIYSILTPPAPIPSTLITEYWL
jgi:hypothetical protein